MKRSETLAWTALAGLIALAILLLIGGVMYYATLFWAGMLLAFGQALVVGLAAWGLALARQRADLQELPTSSPTAFRMSFGNETTAPSPTPDNPEIKTLDTGFQRLLVGLSAALLLAFAAFISWLVYQNFVWARLHPDLLPIPFAGTFDKPRFLDELALLIGLAASALYVILYWVTRTRTTDALASGEAVNSNFTLGIAGMIALGGATLLAYLRVEYAAELAASVIAALLALQGLELLVNAFRSFSAVEELDQEAIDLHALPLVPMLSSLWISGLKMLFAQSVGLSKSTEKTVLGRMMPRVLAALLILGILVSCLRVVGPGRVAILERLGHAQLQPDGQTYQFLGSGLHLTFPWPIDTLVTIPTQELQLTDVGTELHGDKTLGKKIDFQFWTFRPDMKIEENATDSQFVTGDPGSQQILETYVVIMWRVSDPAKFYNGLSHSAFYENDQEKTTAVPIYEALVKQCTSFAVTRTFAIHTLDQIMTIQRKEVEAHCKEILQQKLDAAGPEGKGCGIEVVDLTIKDLHPPLGIGEQADPSQPDGIRRGPASAYENVVNAMQWKERRIKEGEAIKAAMINQATGAAAAEINGAKADRADRVTKAKGEAARMTAMLYGFEELPPAEQKFMQNLAQHQAMYTVLKDVLAPVNKIIVDPTVKNVDLYQTTDKSPALPRPPG